MAIEFVCACGQVLRSGEDRVGKKVRCPSCWAIQLVPQPAPQMMPADDAFGVADERPAAPPSALGERYQSSAVFMTGVHDAVPDSTDMMAAVRPRNSKPPARPAPPPPLMAPVTRPMSSGMRPAPPVKKPSSSAMPAQMRVQSGDLGDTVEGPGDDTLVGSPDGEANATQAASGTNTAAVMMLFGGVLMFAAVLVYVLVGRS